AVKAEIWEQTLGLVQDQYVETGHSPTPDMLEAIREELLSREIYQGLYTVAPGENAEDLVAEAFLEQPGGTRAEALYAEHPISIDTLAPAAPVGLMVEMPPSGAQLAWTANLEHDVTGYEVHSLTPGSSETALLASTAAPGTGLAQLSGPAPAMVQVRAVDAAGNAGPFSQALALEGMPMGGSAMAGAPQADTVLGGVLDSEVRLTAERSPYLLSETLTVAQGGVLYIEPGVTILAAERAAIIVDQGEIHALGQESAPITLTTQGAERHNGIVLDQASQAELVHMRITSATTGVTVRRCEASLKGLVIVGSSQAGIFLASGARPVIEGCRIEDNQGMGGLVIEGDVDPLIRANTFLNNQPFQVQCFTPREFDLRGNYWGSAQPPTECFLGNLALDPVLAEPGAAPDLAPPPSSPGLEVLNVNHGTRI
ncbi:MAG: right-handed parallel beta-helix repeat-containing protein, partial [Desulfovibrio sp.]